MEDSSVLVPRENGLQHRTEIQLFQNQVAATSPSLAESILTTTTNDNHHHHRQLPFPSSEPGAGLRAVCAPAISSGPHPAPKVGITVLLCHFTGWQIAILSVNVENPSPYESLPRNP